MLIFKISNPAIAVSYIHLWSDYRIKESRFIAIPLMFSTSALAALAQNAVLLAMKV
jgi:hypothetical protein